MSIEEMKNKAYKMAKDEEYTEAEDLAENYLLGLLYAAYRLFLSGLLPEAKARAMILKAIRDYKVFKLHEEMYLEKGCKK